MLDEYIRTYRIPRCRQIPRLSEYLRQSESWEEMSYNSNFLNNLSKIGQLNKGSQDRYSSRGFSSSDSV